MTPQKGAAFLLKIGDGAQPPAYDTVAGLRTTQMAINGDPVVVTHKQSGGWRALLSGAGTRSVSVSAAGGNARSWYVRLWNYAQGTPEDAVITLPFSGLADGFAPGGEAVHPSRIARMFISLCPPGYVEGGTARSSPNAPVAVSRPSPRSPTSCSPSIAPMLGSSAPPMARPRAPGGNRPPRC